MLEWQVQFVCIGIFSIWSNFYIISIMGCLDVYCYFYGNSWSVWIISVVLSNLFNNLGNGNGYFNFINLIVNVV